MRLEFSVRPEDQFQISSKRKQNEIGDAVILLGGIFELLHGNTFYHLLNRGIEDIATKPFLLYFL